MILYCCVDCYVISHFILGLKHRCIKPRPNERALFGKRHLKFCSSSTMSRGVATTLTCAWQTYFACDKQKMFLNASKPARKAMFALMAKRTSMLDKQDSKCLSSNACTYTQGAKGIKCEEPKKIGTSRSL